MKCAKEKPSRKQTRSADSFPSFPPIGRRDCRGGGLRAAPVPDEEFWLACVSFVGAGIGAVLALGNGGWYAACLLALLAVGAFVWAWGEAA